MTDLFTKHFLPDNDNKRRKKAGIALGLAGIGINLLLFVLKAVAGDVSSSISITADALNNFTDSAASVLTVLGFVLGDKAADKKHPMGYGRIEYLSGVFVSVVVMGLGVKMICSSTEQIFHPDDLVTKPSVIVILIFAVIIKGMMYLCYSKIGKAIESSSMQATALDSLADCFATIAILAALVIESATGFNADGYTGMLVAFCILYAGVSSFRESLVPLIGKGLDKELEKKLQKITEGVKTNGAVLHDYGPHKKLLTMYIDTYDAAKIEEIREKIKTELELESVICPIQTHEKTLQDKNKTTEFSQK